MSFQSFVAKFLGLETTVASDIQTIHTDIHDDLIKIENKITLAETYAASHVAQSEAAVERYMDLVKKEISDQWVVQEASSLVSKLKSSISGLRGTVASDLSTTPAVPPVTATPTVPTPAASPSTTG